MSNRYKGAVISATPPTTTGGESGTASGAWTLEQQMQLQAAGLWPAQPTGPYIEELFSTYLYTGNGTSQTITNNINLSGKGGLVWAKYRNSSADNILTDTVRGATKSLYSNSTAAEATVTQHVTGFTSSGFSVGNNGNINDSGGTYVSWTFREQAKFFDVVTYTGNGVFGREISHNLGAVPAVIIIKATSIVKDWLVYTTAVDGSQDYLFLNTTAAKADSSITTPWTSTTFPVGGSDFDNGSGVTYVAYLFASNAGGFGLTGTDNVISCGSFSVPDQGPPTTVTLGYEPQWIMVKRTNGTGNWKIFDTMRGWEVSTAATDADDEALWANLADAANPDSGGGFPTATGFVYPQAGAGDATYIYIAIRRGPMRVPTSGTSVFAPVNQVGAGTVTTNFPVDLSINTAKSLTIDKYVFSRLIGSKSYLTTNSTAAESTSGNNLILFDRQNSIEDDFWSAANSIIYWNMRRAPSFFDVVCYTGTGSATTQAHNLGVVPELVIWKRRSSTSNWRVWQASFSVNDGVYLDSTFAKDTDPNVQTAIPTATVLNLATGAYTNASGSTYVAYLFATCAGVSKVGTYTGTGAAQTINCGFAAGSRFVMIKRTDSTGDWYVWDSARGIIPSNDPYLLLNSTAAEVTGTDYVDTTNVGFDITSTAPAGINANGGTYIFLAIA